MGYESDRHNRRSIRLKQYDYSLPGWYYVTICTQDRAHCFGAVKGQQLYLNDAGRMVEQEWNQISCRFRYVVVDRCVVMPDHFHGILQLTPHENGKAMNAACTQVQSMDSDLTDASTDVMTDRGRRVDTQTVPALFELIGTFKSLTTHRYIQGIKQDRWPSFRNRLWQRGYYERVLRGEGELGRIRQYIMDNPLRWTIDVSS